MRCMHRSLRAGMPVEELETPILVIDMDAMERNLSLMMSILEGSNVRLRPHLKTAKSPALAQMMIQAGAIGICCAKLSEAEVMANAGITDILLTSEVAGFGKYERLVALSARLPEFKAVVDSEHAINSIAAIAQARGVTVKLMIELDVNTGRSGQVTARGVLGLADLIRETDGVELAGIHAYAGHAQIKPEDDRKSLNDAAMERLSETLETLHEHNHETAIVSGGGSGSVRMDVRNGLLNEVQAGSFLLMDTAYRDAGVEFENALTCLSTIISRPTPERAVCDAGLKTLTRDGGTPEVTGRPGVYYVRGSDEHGSMTINPEELTEDLPVGSVISIIPSHVCTTINQHDVMVGVRNGYVEAIYPVDARGHIW
jgi:D-serine deaminase-like pyridoxal phosphate-dependent protein